jgi:hypothetical protein
MKTIKLLITVSFLLLGLLVKAAPPDTTGMIKMLNGRIIYLYENYMEKFPNGDLKFSTDRKVKEYKVKENDIKWLVLGNKVYCGYGYKNYDKKSYSLEEVIAITKDYVLACSGNGQSGALHIYNLKDSKLAYNELLYIGDFGKKSLKKSAETLEKLREYFGQCKELLSKMQQNLDSEKYMIDGIHAISCNGGPDIKEYMETYKDYRTE